MQLNLDLWVDGGPFDLIVSQSPSMLVDISMLVVALLISFVSPFNLDLDLDLILTTPRFRGTSSRTAPSKHSPTPEKIFDKVKPLPD